MAKRIRKAVSLGTRIAVKAKEKLKKELNMLISSGIIDKKEAKRLYSALITEIKTEKERIKTFAKQEIKRGFKKAAKRAKPLIKRAIKRYKR